MKKCSKCGLSKDESEFWKSATCSDGFHAWCKGCASKHHKEWAQKNQEKVNSYRRKWCKKYPGKDAEAHARWYKENRELSKSRFRQAKYGLSPQGYKTLVDNQGGVCEICSSPGGPRGLHIDHNHTTGKVRALLCGHCNLAIGHLQESEARALAVAAYLKKHQFSDITSEINKQPET